VWEKNQKLTLELPAERTEMFADKVRLSQVLSNLVTNAAKYSGENSEISIAVTSTNEDVIMRVTDRGIGIARADISHIFGAFFRADNEATRMQSGTGVGLYFCDMIVGFHRGSITVESEVGQGTTMTVRLPREYVAEGVDDKEPVAA
jgi:signal transduction histidine kinase